MKKQVLFGLWAAVFIICAALGFVSVPAGPVHGLLTLLSICFFIPPSVLLYGAAKTADKHTILLVRNLSMGSLILTVLLLILNLLSVMGSEAMGDFLYYVLIIVSSPMICSGSWALSLFLWACLLMVSLQLLKKK